MTDASTNADTDLADRSHRIVAQGAGDERPVPKVSEPDVEGDDVARMLPRTDVVIVTTPAKAAQQVAARPADMARKGYLRVAGVIENMGPSSNPDGTVTAMFGSGGGQRLAEDIGVPLLGSIPLDPAVAATGDAGIAIAMEHPDSAAGTRA